MLVLGIEDKRTEIMIRRRRTQEAGGIGSGISKQDLKAYAHLRSRFGRIAIWCFNPLHGRFESEYVKANIKPEDFSGLVKTATRLQDPFADIVKYLIDSCNQTPGLYRLEKTDRSAAGNRNAASKKFVAERLAAGSQMLASLWYTAWLGSANTKADGR
jgi:hypothetical protein